jgi:hypothetical protein
MLPPQMKERQIEFQIQRSYGSEGLIQIQDTSIIIQIIKYFSKYDVNKLQVLEYVIQP